MDAAQLLATYVARPVRLGVSVASVEDFCDSMDHLRSLATAAGDLKDQQRPWAYKSILGSVPRGSRLCEIGAGEPLVAEALQKLGYSVTIVDPYEGLGQGPTEFDAFRERCPGVRFVRSHFGENMPEFQPGEFDAIYSISVLEHVPLAALPSVARGIRKYLRTYGRQFHAIDYVAAGAGDAYHRQMLGEFLQHFAIGPDTIDPMLAAAATSAETYYLSAEGHNRWRGAMPYKDFPMRKVLSVQIALENGA